MEKNHLYESFKPMFLSEQYSDLTILCGNREFKAHRVVVCTQSTFFAAACRSQFKEARTGVIELPEDDPDIFHKFLEFLYTGTYEDGEYPNNGPDIVALKRAEEIEEVLQHEHGAVRDGIKSVDEVAWDEFIEDDEFLNMGPNDSIGTTWLDPPDQISSTECYEPHTVDSDSYAKVMADIEGGGDGDIDLLDDAELELLRANHDEIAQEAKHLGEEFASVSVKGFVLTETPYSISLQTSVSLYIMADKYDVPALRLLTRERFYRTAQVSLLRLPDLADVLDQIYTMTCEEDHGIRAIPARIVGAEYPFDSKLREKVQPVMIKHGDFCLRTLHYSMYSATKAGLGPHPEMTFPKRDRRKHRSLRPLGKQKTRGGQYRVSKGGKVLHDS